MLRVLACVMLFVMGTPSLEAKIVKTTLGKLAGFEDQGLQVFLGIPFAKPPVGRLRFRAPQPMKKWNKTKSAKTLAPAAPQAPSQIYGLSEFSEDCLYLNVWSPGLDNKKRPVMFWIHGGANTGGSASQAGYAGTHLAKRGDVVVVSANYRLGPLGFANFRDVLDPKYKAEANVALLDQVAALQWVRDNIENFGGDPSRVTVFGKSAGGMDITTLMAMPAAEGLFHKAICESGATPADQSLENSAAAANAILKALNISADNPKKLYQVSAEDILKTQGGGWGGGSRSSPSLDGKVVPVDVFTALADGWAKNVPLLIGTNKDEMKLFTAMVPASRSMTRDGLVQYTNSVAPGQGEKAVSTYEKARKARGEDSSPFELMNAMQTDAVFRMPSIRLAEIRSATQPLTFMYLFDWVSQGPAKAMGSYHGLEIGFVFGTAGNQGEGKARVLSEKMMDAWLAFAKSGNPSHEGLGNWPAYEIRSRKTMRLGKNCRVESDPMSVERKYWEANAPAQSW